MIKDRVGPVPFLAMPSAAAPPAVDRLFRRHKLGPVRSVERLHGGRLNTVLRVDGEWVLRYREAALSTGSLLREAAVLETLAGRLPLPEPLAHGMDDLLGEYLIERWVPGQSLLRAWLANPDVATREWWLVQWISALKAIHEVRYPRPGELVKGTLQEHASWRGYIESRIRKRLDLLMRVPGLDRGLILAVERYLRQTSGVLEDGPFCLIHRDLHFGNALVDGPHLSAVLDFELAEAGPPDYELDAIVRFLRRPAEFADAAGVPPAELARVTPMRFASVWVRLRKGYPELFAVRNLRERLCLYALDHDLSCLAQAYSGRWGARGEAASGAALDRIAEVLQGRYGPPA
ncbi:MAG: phosphotransferase family protein [Armatimonadota bacterium]